jgi:hypothetical protein
LYGFIIRSHAAVDDGHQSQTADAGCIVFPRTGPGTIALLFLQKKGFSTLDGFQYCLG